MTLWVVDAHLTYQQGLDVGRLFGEGFNALIVKATQGATGYTAPGPDDWPGNNLEAWLDTAERSGMLGGTYHWSTASSASSQLDHWFGRVNAAGGFAGRLAAIDFEDSSSVTPKATLLGMIDGFMDRTGGRPLLLYSGKWFIDGYAPWVTDYDFSAHGPVYLWDSHYVSASDGWASSLYAGVPESWWSVRYGRMAPTLLQFTSKAKIGGLARVDASAFRGTIEQLRALAVGGSAGGGGTTMDATVERNLVREIDAAVNGAETAEQTSVADGAPITKPVVPNIRLRRIAQRLGLDIDDDGPATPLEIGAPTDAQVSALADRVTSVVAERLEPLLTAAAEIGAKRALAQARVMFDELSPQPMPEPAPDAG